MLVSVNMSREVYDYFKGHDLSQVADALLEMYDFTNLPQRTGAREVERRVNVTNEAYIQLYEALGPRSKKISLGRLFEFGYNMDILSHSRFESMKRTGQEADPTLPLVTKAYKALLEAYKYRETPALRVIVDCVYEYKKILEDR